MAKDDQSSIKGLSRSWAILGIVYAAFFYWYTSFGGPLSDEEIAHYTEVLASAPAMSDHSERWISFMKSDTGDDFAMWNAVDLFDTPKQVKGVEPGHSFSSMSSGLSARAAPTTTNASSTPPRAR